MRGTGQGERGPDADKGSYDSLAYWCRAGVAMGMKHEEYDYVPMPPAPAFGDSIGAMTIAGGIMGALFHRERTGEATTVDVSLLGVGLWSMGAALALSLQHEHPWAPLPPARAPATRWSRPTDQRRPLRLARLPPGRPSTGPNCATVIGRPELATDERFAGAAIAAHTARGDRAPARGVRRTHRRRVARPARGLQRAVGRRPGHARSRGGSADRRERLRRDCATADGTPFKLAAAPVQYDEKPAAPRAAPEFNEHGDAILEEIGFDMDTIVDLKVRGVVN